MKPRRIRGAHLYRRSAIPFGLGKDLCAQENLLLKVKPDVHQMKWGVVDVHGSNNHVHAILDGLYDSDLISCYYSRAHLKLGRDLVTC